MSKKAKNPQIAMEASTELSITKNEVKEIIVDFRVEDNPHSNVVEDYKKVVINQDGKAIFYGNEHTKVLSPVEIGKACGTLDALLIPYTLQLIELSEYSIQGIFSFPETRKEIKVGDSIESGFVMTCSGDNKHSNGIDLIDKRLVCANGMTRTSTKLNVSKELFEAAISHLENSLVDYQKLIEIPFKWTDLQSQKLTSSILKTGFGKGDIERAHYYAAQEYELNNNILTGWEIYNAFNKALFETSFSSITYPKRKNIDEKLIETVLNYN
jgi:hypothetical protein